MLEIDQGAVISTKLENVATDTRSILRKNKIRYTEILITDTSLSIKLKNSSDFTKARDILTSEFPDIQWAGQEPVADSDKLGAPY